MLEIIGQIRKVLVALSIEVGERSQIKTWRSSGELLVKSAYLIDLVAQFLLVSLGGHELEVVGYENGHTLGTVSTTIQPAKGRSSGPCSKKRAEAPPKRLQAISKYVIVFFGGGHRAARRMSPDF